VFSYLCFSTSKDAPFQALLHPTKKNYNHSSGNQISGIDNGLLMVDGFLVDGFEHF
jgi:hypothetical protein